MTASPFDLETLLQEATEKTQLTDFGPHDFREGLGVLLETYKHNNFTEKGQKRLRRRVLDLLCARLRIEAGFKNHPAIRDEIIQAPLFLTGLPRTGTSALLNLLSCDPASRPLYLWEGFNPDPLPGNPTKNDDPRYQGMRAYYDKMNQDPAFKKIHATSPDTPEECIHLLNHTFQDVQYGFETMLEPYGNWFQQQDLTASYNYYGDILKMLQWQRPGERWLLKTPAHLWALDHLVRLFPDCKIIITHRNPVESVTSYASMMAALMKDRDFDLRALGPVVMEYLARKLEKSFALRQEISEQQIVDLRFSEFIDNPMAVVDRIYGHFELPTSNEMINVMKSHVAAHPMGKHGKHEYELEKFGLSERGIMDRFEWYLAFLGEIGEVS